MLLGVFTDYKSKMSLNIYRASFSVKSISNAPPFPCIAWEEDTGV